jgi:hypothetical protein
LASRSNGRGALSKNHFNGAGGLANLDQLYAFDDLVKNSGVPPCQTPQ